MRMKGIFFSIKKEVIPLIAFFCINHIAQATTLHGLSYRNINEDLLAFLNETYVLECPDMPQATRADVTYMFADIKFRDGALKICEFGEGKNSGQAMSQVLINGKPYGMIKPYWSLFWVYLAHVGIPVWYVGVTPKNKEGEETRRKAVAWDQFIAMGGRYALNLRSLELDKTFAKLATESRSFAPNDLNGYKGIIVYSYADNKSKIHLEKLNAFKKKHPDFLVLDDASWVYGASKRALARLLSDKNLSCYKPLWNTYKKRYYPGLAQKIISDLKSDMVVIKPINSGRSNGVIMVDKKNLDKELKKILIQYNAQGKTNDHKKELGIMPMKTKLHSYWAIDTNKDFMVEAYESSKRLCINNKQYDPSMRVVFVARYDSNKIYVNILGAYWKIPHKSLDDVGTLTEKHKTISVKQPGYTGILVEAEDLAQLKKIGLEAFAKIYEKMIKTPQDKKMKELFYDQEGGKR